MAESDDFGGGGFRRFRRDSVDALPIGEIGDDRIERTRSWTVDHSADYLSIFAYAAYAGLGLSAPTGIGPPDIVLAFQDVDFYDLESVTARGLVTDLVNGTFTFALEGVYAISITYSIEHNDNINFGRTFDIRLFNQTTGLPITGLTAVVGTGRNQGVTVFSSTILLDISAAAAGQIFVVQVGNAATVYSAVIWNTCSLNIWNVGEFRGVLTGSAGGLATLRDL